MISFEFDYYGEPQTLIKKEEEAKSPLDVNPKKKCRLKKIKFIKKKK
jgi:hypothetical protein